MKSETDANVESSTTAPIEDKFYKTSDVKAKSSPAENSETPVDADKAKAGAVQTEAELKQASEPADTETEPKEEKEKSPRSSWAEMRTARYRAEAEAKFLREQLAERKAESLPAKPLTEIKPAELTGKPKLSDYTDQIGTKYPTYESAFDACQDDRDAWVRTDTERQLATKQKADEDTKAQAEAEKQGEQHRKAWDSREAIVSAKHNDYNAVFQVFLEAAQANPRLAQAVFESEIGPDIARKLGASPDELKRLAALDPRALLKEIGKLEDKLSNPGSETPITKAPRPLADVGGNASAAGRELAVEEKLYGRDS